MKVSSVVSYLATRVLVSGEQMVKLRELTEVAEVTEVVAYRARPEYLQRAQVQFKLVVGSRGWCADGFDERDLGAALTIALDEALACVHRQAA